MVLPVDKDFTFNFNKNGCTVSFTDSVPIPLNISVTECANRLTTTHNVPCFAEDELKEKLQTFVDEEVIKFYDEEGQKPIDKLRSGKVDVDALAQQWNKAFTEETLAYARHEAASDETLFSEVYHALIHSPALETLLNLEHTYALAVGEVIKQRDHDLSHLEARQRKDMEEAVRNLGITYTDDQINTLAQRHFDNTQLIESKWASELSNLQENQKREYREWVMKVHEDFQVTEGTPAYVQTVRQLSSSIQPDEEDSEDTNPSPQRREESFTVHLGAQLKTMHNIRLVSADVLDLCRHKSNKVGGVIVPQPQRLQTAMSLYSKSLCGLVLLVDNRLNSYTGIKREFAKVCEQSTDFHFPTLEQQFEQIEPAVMEGNEARRKPATEDGDRISLKSSGSSSSDRDDHQRVSGGRSQRLQNGDVYVTRHSNLAEAHIVFHLVTDDSVRTAGSGTSTSAELSSRHPVILAYRNVLKACFRCDIHTITLPLLLVHDMHEEMTIPWCLKRAELVFKCVKGFMMELSTWSGQQSRTIQFLVPKGLSDDTFASISAMLPSIFRMSNPVMARS